MAMLLACPIVIRGDEPVSSVDSPTFSQLLAPLEELLPTITPLASKGNHPLSFTFEYQLKSLVYYHTEAFTFAQDLLQAMREDPFARQTLVPPEGLGEKYLLRS